MVENRTSRDLVVFGAGLYGLHAASLAVDKGMSVAIVDIDREPFRRASYVNQARLHNGYHYPRSAYTAIRSRAYYERFIEDFPSAINGAFRKIYAVSSTASYTDAPAFRRFCNSVDIPLRPVDPTEFFRDGKVAAAYEAEEVAIDPIELSRICRARLQDRAVSWHMGRRLSRSAATKDMWVLDLDDDTFLETPLVLNATYAGINSVIQKFGFEPFGVKHELCEIALVRVPAGLREIGITVMDGPFFSMMPFGHSDSHSLSAVGITPRRTIAGPHPVFACQTDATDCSPVALDNCTTCFYRPATAVDRMIQLASVFLRPGLAIEPRESLFTVKTVLLTSETDDGRPTSIVWHSRRPGLVSILSGKLNTIYDLEDVI